MRRTSWLILALAVAAGCGGNASAADPRLDLALAAPAESRSIRVPGAHIRRDDAAALDAARKHIPSIDGTVVTASGAPIGVLRQLAGQTWVCTFDASTADTRELGRATCLGLRAEGQTLVVPFALSADRNFIVVDAAHATLSPEYAGDAQWTTVRIGARDLGCKGPPDRDRADWLCTALRAP